MLLKLRTHAFGKGHRCNLPSLRRVRSLTMRPNLISVVLASFWAVLVPPSSAHACDCGDPGPPCRAFAKTPTVFTGQVARIGTIRRKTTAGDEFENRLVYFHIEKIYRNLTGTTVEVVTGFGGGDCGYDFHLGGRYIVYAYPFREAAGKLYTGICTRTRPISEAADDLEYLSKKDEPGHDSGIEGYIQELARDPKDGTHTEVTGPAVGVDIVVTEQGAKVGVDGQSGRWTIVTDKAGRFRLWGLKPGSYTLTAHFSQRFLPHTETVKVESDLCATPRILATPPP